MNVLIVDTRNVGLSFAWRCAMAGHSVRWFVKPSPEHDPATGQGFKGVEKIENWVSSAPWADLIFATSGDFYVEKLDFFRNKGKKVCSPTVKSLRLEGLCRRYFAIPDTHELDNLFVAEELVRRTGKKYRVTSGTFMYEAVSAADTLNCLQHVGEVPVVLQEIVDGCPVTVSRWLGTDGWVGPIVETVGQASAFSESSKLFGSSLSLTIDSFLALGYTGNVSLKLVVDSSGALWCVDAVAEPLWPLFDLLLGATKGDPAQWMLDSLHGANTLSALSATGVAISAALPANHPSTPIYGIGKGNRRHLHPQTVKIDLLNDMDGGKIVTRPLWNSSGDRPIIVTGYGKDIQQASSRAEKTMSQLSINGVEYQNVAAEKYDLSHLHAHGYATSLQFETRTTK